MASYFVKPLHLKSEGYNYMSVANTYTEYNYLQRGVGSILRVSHFEHALQLTKGFFHKCNVIDFGCADGPFLPSLSKHFNHVMGIDEYLDFILIADKVAYQFTNIDIINNRNLSTRDLKAKLKRKYQVLYLLETLEHVGDKDNPWESRTTFIEELFKLIDDDGIIVISVPNMVGVPFFLQRLGLLIINAKRDKVSPLNFLRAAFLNDTTDLEGKWHVGTHLGFNHQKLEPYLNNKFVILKKRNILFQVMYVLGRKNIER
jgi:2-polyprenyl-3-methyl-5-hydroxy-6-metoxy-1,4-benzoquinol methylase